MNIDSDNKSPKGFPPVKVPSWESTNTTDEDKLKNEKEITKDEKKDNINE